MRTFSSLLTLAVGEQMLTLRRNLQSSRSVKQTRLSHFGFETQVSCLYSEEMRTSRCWLSRLP